MSAAKWESSRATDTPVDLDSVGLPDDTTPPLKIYHPNCRCVWEPIEPKQSWAAFIFMLVLVTMLSLALAALAVHVAIR